MYLFLIIIVFMTPSLIAAQKFTKTLPATIVPYSTYSVEWSQNTAASPSGYYLYLQNGSVNQPIQTAPSTLGYIPLNVDDSLVNPAEWTLILKDESTSSVDQMTFLCATTSTSTTSPSNLSGASNIGTSSTTNAASSATKTWSTTTASTTSLNAIGVATSAVAHFFSAAPPKAGGGVPGIGWLLGIWAGAAVVGGLVLG